MPSVLTPSDLSLAQWNFLMAALNAEAGLGSAPAGTSPGSRLAGITYISKSSSLWTGEIPGTRLPAMGCQLLNFKEGGNFGQLQDASTRHAVQTTFRIIIAAQSTDASASSRMGANTPANMEDAMANLQPFVSDGAGNGISPVLRDPQYRTLGTTSGQVNAVRSAITNIDYEWEVGPGEAPQMFAYALVTFTALMHVAIG